MVDDAPELRRFFSEDVPGCFRRLDAVRDRIEHLPAGASIPESEMDAVRHTVDTLIAHGQRALECVVARHLHDEVRACFRARLVPWAAGNPLLETALAMSAPRHEHASLLEALHGPEPVYSGSGLGGVLDRYVRDRWRFVVQRKDHLVQHLERLIEDAVEADRAISILALGTGMCREWLELDWDLGRPAERHERVDLVCIEPDDAVRRQAATRLARNRLLRRSRFVAGDLRPPWPLEDAAAQFDLVYAAGAADLLPDGAFADVVRSAYGLVGPGGHLLVTHTDAERAPLEIGEWLLGLTLERRSARDFAAILHRALRGVAGLPEFGLRHDPGGATLFATIKPPRTPVLNPRRSV